MAYSEDLKQRVLAFVAGGGSKVEAAKLFSLVRATLYVWLGQPPDHQRRKPGPKTGYKIDRAKLAELIKERPDLLQREIAQIMGASANGISRALMAMRVTRKKTLRYSQSCTPESARKRKKYLLRIGASIQKAARWSIWMKPDLLQAPTARMAVRAGEKRCTGCKTASKDRAPASLAATSIIG